MKEIVEDTVAAMSELFKEKSIELRTRAYVPQQGDSEKLRILGSDVAELVSTIDHNLQHGTDDARFQRDRVVGSDGLLAQVLDGADQKAASAGGGVHHALAQFAALLRQQVRRDEQPLLVLRWEEIGGPAVTVPSGSRRSASAVFP